MARPFLAFPSTLQPADAQRIYIVRVKAYPGRLGHGLMKIRFLLPQKTTGYKNSSDVACTSLRVVAMSHYLLLGGAAAWACLAFEWCLAYSNVVQVAAA